MLSVFLLILKIIGILLLSILGILLLMVLFILFVPVRYRLSVKRTGLDGDPPAEVKADVTWLLHLFNVHVNYPAKVYLRVRVFIFTIIRMPGRQKNKRGKNKKAEKKAADPKETAASPIEGGPQEAEAVPEPADGGMGPKQDERPASEAETDPETEETKDQPKKNILHTIRTFYDKIKGIIRQIKDRITHIGETLQSVKENITHYRGVMESRAFKESFGLALSQLSGVLKSIGPKKCRIYIEEGLDDPAATASVLAICGMFYPILYDKVTVVGNFEEQIIKADVLIKGRITVCRILYAGIRIYFNKHVKKLIRMIKKEDRS